MTDVKTRGSRPAEEIVFDRALEVNGLAPRGDGETPEDYITRDDWGANTKAHLKTALEHADYLDQVGATAAVASARDHHDDPNPPDTKPRKR